jgi:hypothetical protein
LPLLRPFDADLVLLAGLEIDRVKVLRFSISNAMPRHPGREDRMVGAALFVRFRGDCKTGRDQENNSCNPNVFDWFQRNFFSEAEIASPC